MKIAHICLASAFTEGMGYQENLLVDINRIDLHDVLVVSDCKQFEGSRIVDTPPEDRVMDNGARLVRLPFDWTGPRYLTEKVKRTRRLFFLLEQFCPDVILYHGVIGWELRTLSRYKRRHADVRIYVDSHEDRHNSGTNWLSYNVQYRMLTRWLASRVSPDIEKFLYISLETKDFLTDVLDLPEERLEYYPLGGIVVPDAQRHVARLALRSKLGISDDQVVFLHSGKMDGLKRTLEILTAFRSVPNTSARLVLVGGLEDDVRFKIETAMQKDDRILFLGWKNREDLNDIMCMADVYVQPGGQSASLQHAICCGLPVMAFPYPSHSLLVRDNGFLVSTEGDMATRMAELVSQPASLTRMRQASYEIAYQLLDYRKLAARLYE
jgi:glycosyltransferase involved in cell wall biosynthesis